MIDEEHVSHRRVRTMAILLFAWLIGTAIVYQYDILKSKELVVIDLSILAMIPVGCTYLK